MEAETLACPYCNSRITVPAAEAASARVRCPRCGDTFPRRAGVGIANGDPAPVTAAEPTAPPRWSNRAIARAILAGMVALAAGGLVFALVTTPWRRANDVRKTPPGAQASADLLAVPVTPPGKLAGLGYLPQDTDVVIGMHVAELLQEREGQQMLETLRQSSVGAILTQMEQKTGLKQDDLDHVLLGVRPTDGVLPQVVVVVQARRRLDPAALAKAMEPARPSTYQGKPLYRFRSSLLAETQLQLVGERTVVMLISFPAAGQDDLRVLPTKPATGLEAVPAPVRELVEKHLPKDAPLWVAGSLERLHELLALVNFQVSDEVGDTLAKVKRFSAAVQVHKDVTLLADIQMADEQSARALAALQQKQRLAGIEVKVTGPPPQGVASDPASKTWVSVQYRGSGAAMAGLWQRAGGLLPEGLRP